VKLVNSRTGTIWFHHVTDRHHRHRTEYAARRCATRYAARLRREEEQGTSDPGAIVGEQGREAGGAGESGAGHGEEQK
jgi:hypothetical protein